MPLRLPPLVALRAFEVVGRSGSLRKAAKELGVSHTVVSRHMSNLEAWFGCKLLVSDFNGATLTPKGLEFHRIVSNAFTMIGQSAESLKASRHSELRVWCAPGLAMLWLMPRLADLRAALGQSDIVLSVRDDLIDFGEAQIDVAIHYGSVPLPGIVQEELVRPRMLPVASHAFIRDYPHIKTPADLLSAPLLHERSTLPWQRWFQATGVEPIADLPGQRLHHAHIAMEAALQGQGVALVNWMLVRPHVEGGRLAEIIASDISLDAYFFAAPAAIADDPLVVRLADWLRTEMRH
jgi:LysR family glycine cleavage system transcriptional activator